MAGQTPKILLVDDDPTILRLVGKWLELAGFETLIAADGREAQEIIRADCPHVLITDWNMPRINGVQLCRWLRTERTPHYVYVVMMTCRDDQNDVVRGLDSGADDYLKKPIDRAELIARLNAGLRIVELEKKLSELARTDPLTGLYNQRTFYDLLEREWERTNRQKHQLSCVVMDLDFFKRVNDTYGHPVGDEVIRKMAEVLCETSRASDIICRYGGEEFCALLPETDETQAVQWAERVKTILAETVVPVGVHLLKFSASFGVAEHFSDVQSPQELVDLADQALMVAKQSGRNRVISFQSLAETTQLKAEEDGPAAVLRGRTARDAMTAVVAPLREDKPLAYAASYFLRFRISSAPVVDESEELVGILSEKDVLAVMLEPNWWEARVSDVMKENVVSYDETTPLTTVYDFLCRVSIRAVAIVRSGKPVGMIGRAGFVHWLINAVTSYLPKDAAEQIGEELNLQELRQNMQQMSRELRFQTTRLDSSLEVAEEHELIPCVVGSGTRIQELVTDLLSHVSCVSQLRWTESEGRERVAEPSNAGACLPPGVHMSEPDEGATA